MRRDQKAIAIYAVAFTAMWVMTSVVEAYVVNRPVWHCATAITCGLDGPDYLKQWGASHELGKPSR